MITKDITKAVEVLKQEDVVAIPTETVYGLAGNIYSEKAIRKIFDVKQRPLFNPLIVHLHAINQVEEIASEFPEKAKKLAQAFWPGSLTLVLKKKALVPDLITAGKDTVAMRVPNHPVTLALLKALDFPLAAPSANPFNRISPTQANHVARYFNNKIPLILDGGTCTNGIESTIIGFENNEAILYRLGAISVEEIEQVVGKISIMNKKEEAPNAPGMLAKHYAPQTKLLLVKDVAASIQQHPNKKIATLTFSTTQPPPHVQHQVVLSKSGDLKEAAAHLYHSLHQLDNLNVDLIIAEELPNYGLGRSINDRLRRAAKN